jgi:amino acid adenylation domain-containing protein
MTQLLQDWVTRQARVRRDRVALVMDQHCMTYGELDDVSNRLARALKLVGCRRGDRVAILMPKSVLAITSIVGVLKADCIYVPLDPASPPPRLARMLASCAPSCMLISGATANQANVLLSGEGLSGPVPVGWMDEAAPPCALQPAFALRDLYAQGECPDAARQYENTRNDPAYLLFTSGSTGMPKGVPITHSNVIHFVEWATRYFGVMPGDRLSGHPPLHFDLSVYDIFGSFNAGAELHLVPPTLNLLPNKLAEFMRQSRITHWFSVPSVLTYMANFDVVASGDFPDLKHLLWCGEVFPTPALIYWMKRLPHVAFTNLYGPTEATIASSYFTLPACPQDERAAIPIGLPCDGEELLVLDEAGREVPPGVIGDLYIGGVGLSPGYWNDPVKTGEVFISHPQDPGPGRRIYKTGDLARIDEDGLVYFVGRADSQIKHRGYRIELGEVESAIIALPSVKDCAVVAVATDGFEGTEICCAYTSREGADAAEKTFSPELRKVLPGYMLPTRWARWEQLPRNANGKVDRNALKEWFQTNGIETSR